MSDDAYLRCPGCADTWFCVCKIGYVCDGCEKHGKHPHARATPALIAEHRKAASRRKRDRERKRRAATG